ncbi:MAG TPA: valine--tRNA ligase [Candidatus Paceibacterota bacterium]
MNKFLTAYQPQDEEGLIYERWEKSGFFNPDKLPGSRPETYTIIMPPPNANGSLHAGHALFITLEDIMIRFERMRGKRALWVPGTDHAGFETQVVYERKLEKEGRSRFGLDPKTLYDEIHNFTLENKKNMESQVRSLGASCDWSRSRFTLDPDIVAEVQKTFIKMFRDGLIYRGQRTINWCPKHQTSLSDVETENVEEKTPFYYLKYGPFEIGTVRPETKFADKYVLIHPDDERYQEYKHGQKIEAEWINGPVTATVIKDTAVDPSFGTGVMTITPWHSAVDFEIAKRHQLNIEQIIDWRGKLLPIAGEFAGINIKDARPKIVEKLKEKGLLARVDENYANVVKRCYKCNAMIEPQVKDQWFVKMAPLAKLALGTVDEGKIRFVPDNYEKVFRYWMKNALDWNISRQIVWGIPIPAWLCDECHEGAIGDSDVAPKCGKCGATMRRDTDTFDTWFSSGQWPLLVLNYPDGEDYKTYYPTTVMETGYDLIFRWVPRMVIFGLYLAKQIPFHTVYLHGIVNDAQGKKMSKSKGNVTNPLELTAKYGTDALRIGLVIGNPPAADLALREDKIKGYKHFANKIWNATRFVLENIKDADLVVVPDLLPEHQKYLKQLDEVVNEVTKQLENFRFDLAADHLYHYFWHTFADVIIEETKVIFKSEMEVGGNLATKKSAQWLLYTILVTTLKLLHPFMPFITETIWEYLPPSPQKNGDLLMIEPWPKTDKKV